MDIGTDDTSDCIILADRGNVFEKATKKEPAYCAFIFCPQIPVVVSVQVRPTHDMPVLAHSGGGVIPSVHLQLGC
jgi:hypothetical protein